MTSQPILTFNDGTKIPQVGLGVWKALGAEAATAVRAALEAGYRHIDTAAIYENERDVGDGLRSSGVKRADVFLTTKLWNEDQGFDSTLRAFDQSLDRLGTDYVDLYLIHWPSPHRGLFVDSWKALVRLHQEGRVRSIGVANFEVDHLDAIIKETGVVPALNQIEIHPHFQQRALRNANRERGILTQSWSPLGQGALLTDPVLAQIAQKHNRTPAQVMIRWHLDAGLIVIPKSVTPSRIRENFDVFGFHLDADDLALIDSLDRKDGRMGPDPMTAPF